MESRSERCICRRLRGSSVMSLTSVTALIALALLVLTADYLLGLV
jgi:hypothetical protein